MFLRNYKLQSIPGKRKLMLLRTLLFAIIIICAIIFSSLTEAESGPNYLMDSLNTAGTVYFDFGKCELKEESLGLLNKLAEELKSSPDAKIEITGHTDNVGSEGFNNNLSVNRAEAVSAYLIGLGVKEQQIIVRGEGFSKPIIDNNTQEHRSLNRRVEFRWVVRITAKPKNEIDESFVNTGSWKTSRTEVTGELSIRDTSGEPITEIREDDVSAVLKWTRNEAEDSADGTVQLFPIDDKKKIAFTFTMDYSGSMFDSSNEINAKKTEKIISMEKAVNTFIENMDNRFFGKIIKFGDVVEIVLGFSRNKSMMKDAVINYSRNRMSTALYKSIWVALKDTTSNSNPTIMKTVIAFTDGEENSSGKITKDSIYRCSDMRGTRVFSVGLIDEPKHSSPLGMNSKGEADLVEIAKRTGGFYYWAKDPASLPYIYKQIYEQIMKSFNISILWNGEKLPPKGTPVTAIVRVKVKGMTRTLYKNYVME